MRNLFVLIIASIVLFSFTGAFAQTPTPDADVNGDNHVDSKDLLLLQEYWHTGQSVEASVSRQLPESYIPGAFLTVTLSIQVSQTIALNSGIAVTETPPTGWVVSSISDGGSWDDTNKQVKWLFMPGSVPPADVTYDVVPPEGMTGFHAFSGRFDYTVDFEPKQGVMAGDIGIGSVSAPVGKASANPQPMDTSGDFRIVASEMMPFIAHWKAGESGYEAPVMMQGIALWDGGEVYHWDGQDFRSGQGSTPTYTPTKTLTTTPTKTPGAPLEEITIDLPNLPVGAKPLVLVRIPAGSFPMGSPDTEGSRNSDEGPVHNVNIGYDFYMGKYEITQAQWQALMGSNPSYFKGDDLPVEAVSWFHCQQFIAALNALGKGTFRLPSEAEWEYACRAGSTTRFYFGDSTCSPTGCTTCDLDAYAWWCGNNSPNGTKVVGQKIPNDFGLYDMHGNVWEWCQDWYHSSYTGAPPDGSAWEAGDGIAKVLRGGGWCYNAPHCRSSDRDYNLPDYSYDDFGFRVSRTGSERPTNTPTPTPGVPFEEIIIDLPDLPVGAKPLVLVRIPSGSFQMGSPDAECGRGGDEGPVHNVNIGYDFYMCKYEVTQAQWQAVMKTTPASGYGVGDDYPVYNVSWNSCREFIATLNALGQGTFRLPSEAEWEYACRAGTTTRFYFGDSLGCADECSDCAAGVLPGNRSDYMWYCGYNSPDGTKEVGILSPNQWGLYGMHGNVREWCQDWWHSDYNGAPTDGRAWISPTSSYRVIRGGYWYNFARACRSSFRFNNNPDDTGNDLGFRIARTSSERPTSTPTPTPEIPLEEITIDLPNLPVGAMPLVLVRIPAGSFQMGSPDTERSRTSDEGPVHTVNIGYDFYMGKYEVTQAQWWAALGSNPAYYYGVGDDYPVYYVSWNDCQNFISALNALGQGTFRLPSEAEWEYACRAGTTTRFYFGDSLGCADDCIDCAAGVLPGNRSDYMWYIYNNAWHAGEEYAHIVGTKLPNAFGLYDMSGNVYEWCQDHWHTDYTGAPTDGSAWVSPTFSYRVLRGGSWFHVPQHCRSSNRGWNSSRYREFAIGFRVSRTP